MEWDICGFGENLYAEGHTLVTDGHKRLSARTSVICRPFRVKYGVTYHRILPLCRCECQAYRHRERSAFSISIPDSKLRERYGLGDVCLTSRRAPLWLAVPAFRKTCAAVVCDVTLSCWVGRQPPSDAVSGTSYTTGDHSATYWFQTFRPTSSGFQGA